MINIYEAQAANRRKSVIIIVFFILFVTLAVYFISNGLAAYYGYEPGGLGVAGIALIISGLLSFASYYFSDKIILGISGARPADRKRDFLFFTVTENLSIASGIPKPNLYVIEDSAPNAFATGRDPEHAVICATTGLLEKLNRTQLEGVIAHELSHIGNRDILLQTIVVVLVGFLTLLSDFFVRSRLFGGHSDSGGKSGQFQSIIMIVGIALMVLSPIIATLIQLAISRKREFLADASGALLTRYPEGLANALRKISNSSAPMKVVSNATAHLFIANPFGAKALHGLPKLFMTHPPMEERIKALVGN